MPSQPTVLASSLWRRFADHCRRATEVQLAAFTCAGDPLLGEGEERAALCSKAKAGTARCEAFYRKVVKLVVQGEEALLFRCPEGEVVFAAPVHLREEGGGISLILLGARATETTVSPKKLLDVAHMAQYCFRAALRGQAQKESCGERQSQVLTLFEVGEDLSRAGSLHELHALALNAIGVLFDVPSAALLGREPGGERYRVLTSMGSLERDLRSWFIGTAAETLEGLSDPVTRVIRVDDALGLRRLGLPEPAERLALFPLWTRTQPTALLAVFNAELSSDDEQMIRGFAVQLSLALENRRLQEEVAARGRELDTFRQLSQQFLGCLDPDGLFQTILAEARKLTGAQKGSLMMANPRGQELFVKVAAGVNEKVLEKLHVQPGQGIAGRVFASGEPILVRNIEQDTRFQRRNRPHYATKSCLSVPITMDRRVVGVLNLSDKITGEIFADEDLRLLQSIATHASLAIERAAYYLQTRELRKISITDVLTGLLNRRYFQERLAEEVDRATRHGHPLSLIMVDIDHFKAYNDSNGHPAGDKALVQVGRALRGSIRGIDVVSRFGGEEFAVILPETRKQEAREIGERIRLEVESLYFPGEESVPNGRLTISLGVAGFPEDATDLKTLIQRADQALYSAKDAGRNRILVFGAAGRGEEQVWTKML